MIVRITYLLSQLLQAALFYYAALKIKARNDTTVLKYVEQSIAPSLSRVRCCWVHNKQYTVAHPAPLYLV